VYKRQVHEHINEDEALVYQEEQAAFDSLITSTDDNLWRTYIPNDFLRYLARRALQLRPDRRGTPITALSITYALGGVSALTAPAYTRNPEQEEFLKPPVDSDDEFDLREFSPKQAKLVKLRDETRSSIFYDTTNTQPPPQGSELVYVESPLLALGADIIPHPWSLDRTSAFEMPRQDLSTSLKLDQTGPRFRAVLTGPTPEYLYTIPAETGGQREINTTLNTNPTRRTYVDAASSLEKLIRVEYKAWKESREIVGMKSATDRIMLDIMVKRSRNAWIGMELALKSAMNHNRLNLLLDDLADPSADANDSARTAAATPRSNVSTPRGAASTQRNE